MGILYGNRSGVRSIEKSVAKAVASAWGARASRSPTRTFASASAIAALAVFAATGCVSVNLGGKGSSKAEGVKTREPSAPFARLPSQHADQAWQNKRTGNTISYLSTCNDPADPPIETILRELAGTFDDARIVKSSGGPYNGREALQAEIEGFVDGVKTRAAVTIFKKNDCAYSLSYVGVERSFDADRGRFQEFLEGFHAP